MRLSSLARKIKITPKQLTEYLSDQGIDTSQGANTKLDQEVIEMVYEAYMYDESVEEEEVVKKVIIEDEGETLEIAVEKSDLEEPEKISEPTEQKEESEEEELIQSTEEELVADAEEEEAVVETDRPQAEEEVEVEESPEAEETEYPSYEPITTEDGELIESYAELAARDSSVKIIKAPKAAPLQGLKIKGKIELPEPRSKEEKKKEKPLDPNEIIYTSGPDRKPKAKSNKKPFKKRKPRVNTVELERRKKEKEEKRRKAQKERKEKEAKKQYYETKVQAKVQTQPAKPKKNKKTSHTTTPKDTNPIKRFWKWLNT
ncbi:translation initiation factor IF-2 N-terminal domain-containing protein [Reichenbachiella ulvae]|uniref:Translation initiation factor IF-2 N-terminal domain-containing protein n=1 Tax=Reichenbachiella ulvae TaxID=2980104 RepID=A0ABT3CU73_9BACT|nr:translation initiation factor IF-2 N-terminal domain-containing protein [Reichenbachiella ulvae]MCV9387030.1 translation initiation factor IF-2 N-terminal domain-containing protein [Reichenbachiella ulvae]